MDTCCHLAKPELYNKAILQEAAKATQDQLKRVCCPAPREQVAHLPSSNSSPVATGFRSTPTLGRAEAVRARRRDSRA